MIETKFKETELGRIPEDWEVYALGELGEPRMCKRIMKYQTNDVHGIPFIKSVHLVNVQIPIFLLTYGGNYQTLTIILGKVMC